MLNPVADRRRLLGRGINLSPLAFGTMRLDRIGDARAASDLIRQAIDLGVNTFHASTEYDTWPLFVDAWRMAGPDRQDVALIAKVAAPHFGQDAFVPSDFTAKVDAYRTALGLDRIAVVQWLLRHDLRAEEQRLDIFNKFADVIGETVQTMRGAGDIGAVVSFPYTRPIAESALSMPWCDGLALYCNAFELDMVDMFDQAEKAKKAIIAIRPFAAGRIFAETSQTAMDAIAMPLSHPAVVSVVASLSSTDRLSAAEKGSRLTRSDRARWIARLRSLRENSHV